MILAITGGTGFVGSHVIDLALAEGHQIRALTRRAQPERPGVTWIRGDLTHVGALAERADAIIHIAGVLNVPDRDAFVAGNVTGTRIVLEAARKAGVSRFVHVSSLSAREPQLSNYGWSKAEADKVVMAADRDWTIVRPPAVFGPRDTETRDLFVFAAKGLLPLPPRGGRMSPIFVKDLARLLLALAPAGTLTHEILEPDDGRGGWDHRDFARAIGRAVGRNTVPLSLPAPILRLGSAIDGLLRGKNAKLTPDRVGYLCHPDWVSRHQPPASVWAPRAETEAALAETAEWYRAQGLL